jgi:opacity protein-like surface antigen
MQLRLIRTARFALFAGFALVAAPAPAAADFLVTPFFAWARTPAEKNGAGGQFHPGGGVGVDWTNGSLIAGGEIGYTAGFFDPPENTFDLIQTSHMFTIGGEVGVTRPPASERRFYPYATAGVGILRQQARDRAGLVDATRDDWAFNIGGGARLMFTDYFGVRGDLRYFRDLQSPGDQTSDLVAALDKLAFWRVSAGIVLRFNY